MKYFLIGAIVFITLTSNRISNFSSKAIEAEEYCRNHNLDTNYCILIDMSIHSGKERLVVYNFDKKSIEHSALVSHGCGSSSWSEDFTKEKPTFSNVPESHLSSIGKYSIGKRGWSNWGIHVNYKLHGLESSNSNAYERLIVLHGWNSVQDSSSYPMGSPEGYGCPAVSNNTMRILDTKLKGKKKDVLLWIYP